MKLKDWAEKAFDMIQELSAVYDIEGDIFYCPYCEVCGVSPDLIKHLHDCEISTLINKYYAIK